MLGLVFAWAAREELIHHEGETISSHAFVVVCLFAGLVELPVIAVFLAFYGDWSYGYLFSASAMPSAIDGALALAACALTPLAFARAIKPATMGQFDILSRAILTLGGASLALILFGWKRFTVLGTIVQYREHIGLHSVSEGRFGLLMVTSWLVLGGATALTWHELARAR
jgi:hypothetical protein